MPRYGRQWKRQAFYEGFGGKHGEWGGPPWMRAERRRGRGVIRGAVLGALKEGPAHGYEIITRLEEKSGGMWRPSPGSIYPTLQMLADEGLVVSEEREGRRIYELTEKGRSEAEERLQAGEGPLHPGTQAPGALALREAVGQLHGAARQIARDGNPEHVERATTVVKDARRALYQLLAED